MYFVGSYIYCEIHCSTGVVAATESEGLHHPWTDGEIVLACCMQSLSL